MDLQLRLPAELLKFKIDLLFDDKTVRVKLTSYSKEQRLFLKDFVEKIVHHGMEYYYPTAQWVAAALLVPKPAPVKFWFTVDLRPVKKDKIKHQYPMPILENELIKISNSTCFATFDFSNGYCQLTLHRESQSSQSVITPDDILSPTRALHGTTNAVTNLQSTLAQVIRKHSKDGLLRRSMML